MHGLTSLASTRGYGAAGREILDAADNLSRDGLKVQPNVQQTGGLFTKGLNAGFRNMPFVGTPAERHARRFVNQTEAAFQRTADETAGGAAKPMTDVATDLRNPSVTGSLAHYEPAQKAALQPQYDAIDAQAANVSVKPVRALAFLDKAIANQTARFRGAKADWLPIIQDIRNDFAKGDVSFSNMREYRTSIRDELQEKLGDGWRNMAPAQRRNIEGVLDGLYKAATDDIHQALRVNGLRDASKLLKGVDGQYAEVANTAKALRPLLDLPPEQLAPRLEKMAQDRGGDAAALEQAMKVLGPQQKANLQAAFVQTLGESNAGKATHPNSASLESFLTRWGGDGVRGGMSNEAKNLLFTGQTRRDLDDLATLARAQRRYYQTFGNPSGTARTAVGVAELMGGGSAAWSGALFHPGAWGPALGGFVTAHMVTTPGFARLLVNLSEKGATYVPAAARRLEMLARRNPGASAQFLGLRDALLGNQHPNTVAVGGQDKGSSDDGLDYWMQQNPDEPERHRSLTQTNRKHRRRNRSTAVNKRILFVGGYLTALAFVAGLVLILWLGHWHISTQPLRLNFLGEAMLAFIAVAALFGLGVLMHGGLRGISFKAGPVEASLNGEDSKMDTPESQRLLGKIEATVTGTAEEVRVIAGKLDGVMTKVVSLEVTSKQHDADIHAFKEWKHELQNERTKLIAENEAWKSKMEGRGEGAAWIGKGVWALVGAFIAAITVWAILHAG
jgi:hypothetical protein